MYQESNFPPQSQAVRQLTRGIETAADSARQHDLLSVMASTLIPTPSGPVAAQSLAAGDSILDEKGAAVRITNTLLIPCTRAALLENRALAPIRVEPSEDDVVTATRPVLLAPDHPIYCSEVADICVPVAALENGLSIRRVVPDEGIDYIRLNLARPATLVVAGLRLRLGDATAAATMCPVAIAPRPEGARVFRPVA